MYICENEKCKKKFKEPDYERVCLEAEYGVGSMFSNYNYEYIGSCPYCGGDYREYIPPTPINMSLEARLITGKYRKGEKRYEEI